MKSSVILIYNPFARRAADREIVRAETFLEKKGFAVEVLRTERGGHACHLATEAVTVAPSLIVAAGGDGTVNEVMNGVVGTEIPLAVLPMGTTNVLAKELAIPEDLYGALEAAITRKPRRVSLGKVETGGKISPATRYFCLMAGIGLDGKTVHDVNASLKKLAGKAAYILSGLENIVKYSPERLSIIVDGRDYSGYSAVVGKAARYGGNFKVTPDADLLDPFIYACIFEGGRRRDLLRYSLGVIRGSHLRYRDVVYIKATEIEVRGTAHMQVDGDYLGLTPARISVAKDALYLVY